MGINPTSSQELQYNQEPVVVASALVMVLEAIGEIKVINREAGRIQGTLGKKKGIAKLVLETTNVAFTISKIPDGTNVKIELSTNSLHQNILNKGMALILEEFNNHSSLTTARQSGW